MRKTLPLAKCLQVFPGVSECGDWPGSPFQCVIHGVAMAKPWDVLGATARTSGCYHFQNKQTI